MRLFVVDHEGHRFCLDVLRQTTVGAVKELIKLSKVIHYRLHECQILINHVMLPARTRMYQRSTNTSTCRAKAGLSKGKKCLTLCV